MIGYLRGQVLARAEPYVLIEVSGVGYEVYTGNKLTRDLGDEAELWIHTHVREDQMTLFGFNDVEQKAVFLKLNTVTGIGPKLAYAVVSEIEMEDLLEAITCGNERVLQSVSGIGRKTAQRVVLELRDKMSGLSVVASSHVGDDRKWRDLVDALLSLGFADQKIRNVIRFIRAEPTSREFGLDQLLKLALQRINTC